MRYHVRMDVAVLLVVVGCAVVGVVWGAVRLATAVAAIVAAVLAGRWVGPVAASWLVGGSPTHGGPRVIGTVAAALVAGILVLIAGRGLQRGMEALHLGWLDRIAGAVLSACGAALVVAVMLALAAEGGHPPASPWALGLAGAGKTFLALHNQPRSIATPSRIPATPTSSGQQPH